MKKFYLIALFTVSVSNPAWAQDVGVAECDTLLKHYAQCIDKSSFEAALKTQMKEAVEGMRKSYLELKSQAPRETLQSVCKDNQQGLKDTFEALKCKPM
jgi:hypothetical protein